MLGAALLFKATLCLLIIDKVSSQNCNNQTWIKNANESGWIESN